MKILSAVSFLNVGINAFSFVPKLNPTSSFITRPKRFHSSSNSVLASKSSDFDYALIFDCDGVIIETEELHRLAYNAAFDAAGLQIDGESVHWSVEYYDVLQNTVGGGKNKMFFHFRNTTKAFPTSNGKPAPETEEEQQSLIDSLQDNKTNLYKNFIEEKAAPRPGVIELMDQAIADPKCAVGVCSASSKAAATKVLDVTLGEERRKGLDVCLLGDGEFILRL